MKPIRPCERMLDIRGCVAIALFACVLTEDRVGEIAPGEATPCAGDACSCVPPGCSKTCAEFGLGFCHFECMQAAACSFGCPGGLCSSQCSSGSSCQLDCSGGTCLSRCTNTGQCDVGCENGNCRLECIGSETCAMNCPGSGCTLTCMDSPSCVLTGCTYGCTVNCGGAATCESSCDALSGCIVNP